MAIALVVIISIYGLVILSLWWGFLRLAWFTPKSTRPSTSFSIIIPFRDEAKRLPQLLQDLLAQDYPINNIEIFMVDDASSDQSVAIIERFVLAHPEVQIYVLDRLRQSGSPKKDAIQTAINKASHPWILTTDADVRLPELWLHTYDSFIQTTAPDMIAAPVALSAIKGTTLLSAYEIFDTQSLLAATMGSFGLKNPIMANGANLAYRKTAFTAVGGFAGNDHTASGDDVFLLHKFLNDSSLKVHFLKNTAALVTTYPISNWASLIQQRKRWASKSSGYTRAFAKAVGGIVLLGNVAFTTGMIYLLFLLLFSNDDNTLALVAALGSKVVIDWLLISKALHFTQTSHRLLWYIPVALLHPFLTMGIGVLAFTSPYRWKGRQFKQ